MYILPQILKNSSKNLLVNQITLQLKKQIDQLLEKFLYGTSAKSYVEFVLDLQSFMNQFYTDFLQQYFESLDREFRDSSERKKKYAINKSNIDYVFNEKNYFS